MLLCFIIYYYQSAMGTLQAHVKPTLHTNLNISL